MMAMTMRGIIVGGIMSWAGGWAFGVVVMQRRGKWALDSRRRATTVK